MSTDEDIDFAKGMAAPDAPVQRREWRNVERPGYFGRRRDQKHAEYDAQYGPRNWRIVWRSEFPGSFRELLTFDFAAACRAFYEQSYFDYLRDRPDDVDFICEFTECMDNAPTNVHSGLDYTIQEAYSTHIQDIAVRNVLARLGRSFTGKRTELLVIRSADSNGYRFGPGNVPFYAPFWITRPSLCPSWAARDSTEDFWQSNKWLQVAG